MPEKKSAAYRAGRKVGAAGRPESLNPFPSYVGEHGDWRTGYIDGWADTGSLNALIRERKAADKKQRTARNTDQ